MLDFDNLTNDDLEDSFDTGKDAAILVAKLRHDFNNLKANHAELHRTVFKLQAERDTLIAHIAYLRNEQFNVDRIRPQIPVTQTFPATFF